MLNKILFIHCMYLEQFSETLNGCLIKFWQSWLVFLGKGSAELHMLSSSSMNSAIYFKIINKEKNVHYGIPDWDKGVISPTGKINGSPLWWNTLSI